MADWVLEAKDLTKVYVMGDIEVHALRGLSMNVARGEVISIMGPSVGYLPETNPLYVEMPVYDHLQFAAATRDITGRAFKSALGRVMEACGVREVLHRPVGELSKGYRQRVGLAMAMIHDPEPACSRRPTVAGSSTSLSGQACGKTSVEPSVADFGADYSWTACGVAVFLGCCRTRLSHPWRDGPLAGGHEDHEDPDEQACGNEYTVALRCHPHLP